MAAPARPLAAAAVLAATEDFVADEVLPNVAAWDRDDVLPADAQAALSAIGLAGAMVPVAYGGAGMSASELVPAWRALSRGWISLTGAINPTGLATALLVRHGTEAQRRAWLPRFARGAAQASFSITEPGAGSDLTKLTTSATPLSAGGLRLDGDKRWVAGGLSAEVIFMLVHVDGSDKPSCVVLPADGRGTRSWQVELVDKLGYRGVESVAYVFDGHEAPGAEVLGGDDGLGTGARQMLDALDVGRINVACRALGILDRALTVAVQEARERPIGDGVLADASHAQLRVGGIRARLLACAALVDVAAAAVDGRDPDAADLAIAAKIEASDAAVWAVDRAARLAASRSYGADDELARLRRDAPQTQIGEGANDALLIALSRDLLR